MSNHQKYATKEGTTHVISALRLRSLPLHLCTKTFTFACRKVLCLCTAFTGRNTGKYVLFIILQI